MTDTQLTIIVAAIPATVAAVGALVTVIITAMKGAEREAKAEERNEKAEEKTDTLIEKTAEIHTLTNANLSKVQAELKTANVKIEGLQSMVANLLQAKEVADKVAETAARLPAIAEVKIRNEPDEPVPVIDPKAAPPRNS